MVSGYQNGTIAQLLQAIIGQINFDGEPISNIGNILLSILEQTPYDDEPKSVLAELFLKLKDKLEGRAFTPYDDEPKSVIAEILLSILNETEYDKEPTSRIAELLLELKAELESYAEITTSGAIANFTTSVVKPLVNLKAYFEATQEAGTPTPQSPKAISGVSAVSVYHRGANLWDEQFEAGSYDQTTGEKTPSTSLKRNVTPIAVKPNTNYSRVKTQNGALLACRMFYYDANMTLISTNVDTTDRAIITTPNNCAFVNFAFQNNISALSFNYPSSDTEIHAYNPNSNVTLINLGGTYYGGYVEQDKDGKRELVVTHNYIASYNGEAINEPWISSMDVYSQGTTPTTGAQVVYQLATPFTIALPDGEPITAFNGVNNVWNDSGDTSVTYLAKIEDNLKSTAKFRAEVKEQKEKAKLEKELKELEEKETIKEPTKKA